MLKLQTIVETREPNFQISVDDKIMVVGSCFAQYLGEKLSFGFADSDTHSWSAKRLFANPNGVMYNPLSVARAVEIVRGGEDFDNNDLVLRDGLYHSMLFHGSFSRNTSEETLQRINREPIEAVDVIVLTLGTAYVYFRGGEVVANCHKLPEIEFERQLITVEESVEAMQRVARCYPNAKIIVTLSPIRHLRDGLVQNSLSKATLRVAIDKFCSENPEQRSYFAAYEIVMDELRDYRFTEEDMCHPTLQTREYIWQRFSQLYVCDELNAKIVSAIKVARHASHRQLH